MESVTPNLFRRGRDGRKVLNAFRHHGIGHRRCGCGRYASAPCSTPSGIMESVTGERLKVGEVALHVLNAFRHHGIGHEP